MTDSRPPPPPPDRPRPRASPPAPPPPPRKSGGVKALSSSSPEDRLQDFARTGFAGYRRVVMSEKRRAPRILWLIAAASIVGGGAFLVYQWTRPAPPDDPATVEAPPPAEEGAAAYASLDPERWRSDVDDLERLLFAPPSEVGPIDAFGDSFAEVAGSFAERLRAAEGAGELALAGELDQLANRSRRSDFNVRRLKELREKWLLVRSSRLGTADWLRSPEGADQLAELDVYRDAAEQVRSLVADLQANAEELSSAADADGSRAWDEALFYFEDDLKVLRASLPRRPPASASAERLEAITRVDRVFEQARRLAEQQRNLARFDRGAFERTLEEADDAAAYFERRL